MDQQMNNKDDMIDQIEKQEITNATFKIPTDEFVIPETPIELNTDIVADLDRQLTKSSEPFTPMGISSIKELFFGVRLQYITVEQVRHFINRLPKIEHLDDNKSIFEILQFLSQNFQFAKLIYESHDLDYVNFSTFETADDQIKTSVSDLILNIVNSDPELINSFINQFFPYFYNNMRSNTFYDNGGLSVHLKLAAKFICAIENQSQIECMFSKFTLFVHHTQPEVISSSLYGLIISIKKHSWLLRNQDVSGEKFIKRLKFLGRQKDPRTCSLVFIIFSYLISYNFKYPEHVYLSITELIISYFKPDDDDYSQHEIQGDEEVDIDLKDVIALLTYAFANPSYVEGIGINNTDEGPFDDLMGCFLEAYDRFKYSEKTEAAFVFANFFGFLPFHTIQRYVLGDSENSNFFDCLIDVMGFDDPKIMKPIFNGIFRPLRQDKNLFTDEQKEILTDTILPITESDDEELARLADIVLKALNE